MELRHLRYFVCVAEELHFGNAAQRLGMSQPPLSLQIRLLEDELGVRLFDRTSRRVQLTEAGRQFLPHARETLAQSDRAMEAARLAHFGEVGRLRLGLSPSAPFVANVTEPLSRFRQLYPHVSIELNELRRDDQIARVERGTLDVGIMRAFSPVTLSSGMQCLDLGDNGMVLAMRRDHRLAGLQRPLGLADLEGEPLVLFDSMNGAGFNAILMAHCEILGFKPRVTLEAATFGTVLGLTAAGLGITVLARSFAGINLGTMIFRDIEMPFLSQLLMFHARDATAPTLNFIDLVAAMSPPACGPLKEPIHSQ